MHCRGGARLQTPWGKKNGVACAFIDGAMNFIAIRHVHISCADPRATAIAKIVGQFTAQHDPGVLAARMKVRGHFLSRPHAPHSNAGVRGGDNFSHDRLLVGETNQSIRVERSIIHRLVVEIFSSRTAHCL